MFMAARRLPTVAILGLLLLALLAPTPASASAAYGITTVAGNGTNGYAGDGGRAIDAQINVPSAVVPTRDGGFLIADGANHRVRRVAPDGTITTVAGNGIGGSTGDGGPATSAEL